jgi:hypothetical protein
MSLFDLDLARDRVRRISSRARTKRLWSSVIPLTAHFGSLVTLSSVWFFRTGKFQFQPSRWSDWLVLIVLLFIAFAGVRLLFIEWRSPNRTTVTRRDLYDLIAVAQADADRSAAMIGGDISWMAEMFPALSSLRQNRPNLRLSVYYDKSRVAPSTGELANQLEDLGTQFIPYPSTVSPALKCTLIDKETLESARLYAYARARAPIPEGKREDHLFFWQEYGPESVAFLQAIASLINVLDAASHSPIRIGIFGVNNVGKTRLASAMRDALGKRHRVQLVPDQFRVAHGSRDIDDTYHVLLAQLLSEPGGSSEVCIFDRTLLDNFCFLLLRSRNREKIYRSLSGAVAHEMRKFDLLLNVRREDGDYSADTTFVTGAERAQISKELDAFIEAYDFQSVGLFIDWRRFQESLDRALADSLERVNAVIRRRREQP